MKILIGLFSIFIFSCNSTDSTVPAKIGEGVYQFTERYSLQGYSINIQETFSTSGEISGKFFKINLDSNKSCLIAEFNGLESSYSKPDKLIITKFQGRSRADCSISMPPFTSEPDDTTQIRNIKSNSYEAYIEGKNVPSYWATFEKI